MKKTIRLLIVVNAMILLVSFSQAATITITDQTLNKSFTIDNYGSNNSVFDFGNQLNIGDSISVSWHETNYYSLTNKVVNQSSYTSTLPRMGSYSSSFGYQYTACSLLIPTQNISAETDVYQPYPQSSPVNLQSIFTINNAIWLGNPLSITASYAVKLSGVSYFIGSYNTIATYTNQIDTYDQSLTVVPEPSTFVLFGLGAIGLLMVVMRRKKTA